MAEYMDISRIDDWDNLSIIDDDGWAKYVDNVGELPRADVIEIPKGATNGDVIKAMFPDIEIVDIVHVCGISYVKVRFNDMPNTKIFDLDWWNAPYRLEGRE